MKSLVNGLDKVSNGIYQVEKWALIAAFILMVAVNFINVILRYLVKYSMPFGETLSVSLFMFVILIGGNIAMKTDSEIKIEIFRFKSRKKSAGLGVVCDIVSLIALVCLLLGSIALVQFAAKRPQAVAALPIYYYQLYCLLIVGSVLMLLDKCIMLLKRVLVLTDREGGKA